MAYKTRSYPTSVPYHSSFLHHRFEQSKILKALDDNNAVLDSVHLGGAWNTAKIFPGFTQTKFCGCITQVYYNEVSLLMVLIRRLVIVKKAA